MNFNRIFIVGRLTRDPVLSYLPSQAQVVEFGIATNRKWVGQDGTKQEEVLYADCVCYGKRASTIREYCSKGDPLLIEGRLKLDTWQAQDGTKHSKHRVIVENFEFIGTGERRDKQEPQNSQPEPLVIYDEVPF